MATVTKTIGTDPTGRDYSTISAWEADLDDGVIYASGDDAIGECYNDSDFDESVTIDGGGTVGLARVTLTVASGERHDGTAGTGARVVGSSKRTLTASIDNLTVDWLEWENANIVSEGNWTLAQVIIHGISSGLEAFVFSQENNDYSAQFLNGIIYDCSANSSLDRTAITADSLIDAVQTRFLNLTVHGIDNAGSGNGIGIDPNDESNKTIKNTVVTASSGQDYGSASYTEVTVSHNASSDGTAPGSNSLTNIVTADQYVSTMSGLEDLHLASTSDCIDAGVDLGTSPDGVEIDINGNDRTNATTWDIGAHEYELSAAGADVTGSGAVAVADTTLSASTVLKKILSGYVVPATLTTSSSTSIKRTGSGASTFTAATLSSTTNVIRTSSGSFVLNPNTITIGINVIRTGSGSPALLSPTISSNVLVIRTATGNVVLLSPNVDGSGTVSNNILSNGDILVSGVNINASTTLFRTATGDIVIDGATLNASNKLIRPGSGSLAVPSYTLTSSFNNIRTGSGSLDMASAVVSGNGHFLLSGSGTLNVSTTSIDGSGKRKLIASVDLQTGSPTIQVANKLIRTLTGDLQADSVNMTVGGTKLKRTASPSIFLSSAEIQATVVLPGSFIKTFEGFEIEVPFNAEALNIIGEMSAENFNINPGRET